MIKGYIFTDESGDPGLDGGVSGSFESHGELSGMSSLMMTRT